MANQYQPQQLLTNHAMDILKNELCFLKGVNRDNQYLFTNDKKSGEQVMIRLPARFTGREGEAYAQEDYNETSVPCVIQPLQGVDIDLPSSDWETKIADLKEEILKPAMAQLVNNIERVCMRIAYQSVGNFVGVPGTSPASTGLILSAGAAITNEGGAMDKNRRMLLHPNTQVTLVPTMQGLLNPSATIGKQFETGLIAKDTLGFDHYTTQNVFMHRIGLLGGTPLVNGAGQTGNSIATDGWTASTKILNKGDVVQFDGSAATATPVNGVNPMTRESYGSMRGFAVAADVYSDNTGAATIPLVKDLTPAPDQMATVDISPVDNAKILVFGKAAADQAGISNTLTVQNLAYHKNAFTFAGIGQRVPKGSTEQAWVATDPKTGIQLRFVQQFEARPNAFVNRFDVRFAFAAPYGQLGCRMLG